VKQEGEKNETLKVKEVISSLLVFLINGCEKKFW
jgi:hypothetical protein